MRKNKGFTMIEMLIIVGIIGALVAIGYPYFSGIFEKNRENADITAMQSAHALLETAYNTGLVIEGKGTIMDTKATKPLYYDPSGKLTWTEPEPYGRGTAGDGGITWSYCDDYTYDSAKPYVGGVIYCYYNGPGTDYPGLHVHWSTDGYNGTKPVVPSKPPEPTFPTRPTEAATEPTTKPNPNPNPDPEPDPEPEPDKEPSGSENFKDPIFKNLKSHPFPSTDENWQTTGYRLHLGHVYRFTDTDGNEKIYISACDDPGNNTYRHDQNGTPLPGGNYQWNVISPNGTVLTKNGDEDGKYKLVPSVTIVEYGTIFLDDDGTYYIFKASGPTTYPTGSEASKWIKINLKCPDGCGAEVTE